MVTIQCELQWRISDSWLFVEDFQKLDTLKRNWRGKPTIQEQRSLEWLEHANMKDVWWMIPPWSVLRQDFLKVLDLATTSKTPVAFTQGHLVSPRLWHAQDRWDCHFAGWWSGAASYRQPGTCRHWQQRLGWCCSTGEGNSVSKNNTVCKALTFLCCCCSCMQVFFGIHINSHL